MDTLPADVIPAIAAYAGFFDLARLTVCSKHLSRECAAVASDVLVVVREGGIETYACDGAQWRRCADSPRGSTNDGRQIASTIGKLWRMWRGKLDCFDLKKNEWRYVTEEPLRSSNGCAINLESSTCCAFGGGLIFVGGEEHNLPVHVYRVDPETGAKVELARLPLSRDRPAVGVCDGRLVVLGGQWGTHANRAQEAERAKVLVYEPREGQDDTWSTLTVLPEALQTARREIHLGSGGGVWREIIQPFTEQNVVFQGHRIFIIGAQYEDMHDDFTDEAGGFWHEHTTRMHDWTVHVLNVRTRVWTTLETTLRQPSKTIQYPNYTDVSGGSVLDPRDPEWPGYGDPGHSSRSRPQAWYRAIGFRGDIVVFDQGEYKTNDQGEYDQDDYHPAIHILNGTRWTSTGFNSPRILSDRLALAPSWLRSCPIWQSGITGSWTPPGPWPHGPTPIKERHSMTLLDAMCVVSTASTRRPRANDAQTRAVTTE